MSTEQQPQAEPAKGKQLEAPSEPYPRPKPRGRLMSFAVPFFAVIGYYIVGVAIFAIMASSDAPSGRDLAFFLGYAAERTGPFALVAAIVAGCWWQ